MIIEEYPGTSLSDTGFAKTLNFLNRFDKCNKFWKKYSNIKYKYELQFDKNDKTKLLYNRSQKFRTSFFPVCKKMGKIKGKKFTFSKSLFSILSNRSLNIDCNGRIHRSKSFADWEYWNNFIISSKNDKNFLMKKISLQKPKFHDKKISIGIYINL